jgi:2-(1,2-epoxy-1,2-dihydrophenyl)acetyl-CoA isomerase
VEKSDLIMPNPVAVDIDQGVARLTLNRPSHGNAIDMPLAEALRDAARLCAADDSIRCVVLTGAGKVFCAGGDLQFIGSSGDRTEIVVRRLADTLHAAIICLARMNKPLICLINGPAAGAGMSLAMLGDLVLAAQSAHFTSAYAAIGFTPDGGMSWLLPRLVGMRASQDIIFTSRRVMTDEALSLGLVNRVVADEDLQTEGHGLAIKMSNAATSALGGARALLLDSFATSFEKQLNREAEMVSSAAGEHDGKEGIRAFSEKRPPNFSQIPSLKPKNKAAK